MQFDKMSNRQMDTILEKKGRIIRTETNRFLGMIAEADKRELYKLRKMNSIQEYAAKLGGISPSVVERVIALERKLANLPELARLLHTGAVGYSKIERVLAIATPDNDAVVAEQIAKLGRRELERWVRDLKLQDENEKKKMAAQRASRRARVQDKEKREDSSREEANKAGLEAGDGMIGQGSLFTTQDREKTETERAERNGQLLPGGKKHVAVHLEAPTAERFYRMKELLEKKQGHSLTLSQAQDLILGGFSLEGAKLPAFVEVIYHDPQRDEEYYTRTRWGDVPVSAKEMAERGPAVEVVDLEAKRLACKEALVHQEQGSARKDIEFEHDVESACETVPALADPVEMIEPADLSEALESTVSKQCVDIGNAGVSGACKETQKQGTLDGDALFEDYQREEEAPQNVWEQVDSEKKGKKAGRYIPTKVRNYLRYRYDGFCSFPGCKSRTRYLHHVERFALKPGHDPDAIVPLCHEHERLAHLGLIENELDLARLGRVRLERKIENADEAARARVDRKVLEYRKASR